MRSSKRDAFALLLGHVASLALAAPATILLSRYLGPEGKGVLTIVVTVANYAAVLALLGLEQSTVYFVASGKYDVASVLSKALKVVLVSSTVIAAPTLFVIHLLLDGPVLGHQIVVAATVSGFQFVAIALTGLFLNALRATGHIAEAEISVSSSAAVRLFAAIVLVVTSASLLAVIYIQALLAIFAAALLATVQYWCTRRRLSGSARQEKPRAYPPDLLEFGRRSLFGTVLQGVNQRLDLLLVGAFLGVTSVGVYSVSTLLAEILWIPATALATLAMQRSARDGQRSAATVAQAARLVSLTVAAGGLILAMAGAPLITLVFGASFASAYLPLLCLLPGVWALGVWKVVASALVGSGRPGDKSRSAGLAAAVTIALNVGLIPRFGILGAAVASSCAYAVALAYSLRCYCACEGIRRWPTLLIPTIADIRYVVDMQRRRDARTVVE